MRGGALKGKSCSKCLFGRFPDFDVYLTESLMPVLAQALDALGRQVSRMEQQGSKLDARVGARLFSGMRW